MWQTIEGKLEFSLVLALKIACHKKVDYSTRLIASVAGYWLENMLCNVQLPFENSTPQEVDDVYSFPSWHDCFAMYDGYVVFCTKLHFAVMLELTLCKQNAAILEELSLLELLNGKGCPLTNDQELNNLLAVAGFERCPPRSPAYEFEVFGGMEVGEKTGVELISENGIDLSFSK